VCCTNVSLSNPSLERGAFNLEVDVILGEFCRCLTFIEPSLSQIFFFEIPKR
jgi:hypothetical protein